MTIAAIESMSRYVSPINPGVFPHLALVLLGIGLFFTAWFFVYEVTLRMFKKDQNCNLIIKTRPGRFRLLKVPECEKLQLTNYLQNSRASLTAYGITKTS